MKKVLFSTTALAAASMLAFASNDASAQSKAKPLSIKVGGYFMSKMSVSEQDESFEVDTATAGLEPGYDAFNIVNDSEIHFKGDTTLDNGIKVAITVEMESDHATDGTMDRTYMKLSGGFGQLNVGSYQKASSILGNVAPVVGPDVHFGGGHSSYIVRPAAMDAGVTLIETRMDTSDHMTVTYISPKLADMVFIGASFVPSTATSNAMPESKGDVGDNVAQYDFDVAYNGKMGGADVRADIGYGENSGNDSSNKHWRGGIKISSGGVTFGASYKDRDDTTTGQSGSSTSDALEVYDVGLSYTAGAMTVGATYAHASAPLASGTAGDDEHSKFLVGAQYTMGPGVQLRGQLAYVEYDNEVTTDSSNNSGWAVIGGVRVAF